MRSFFLLPFCLFAATAAQADEAISLDRLRSCGTQTWTVSGHVIPKAPDTWHETSACLRTLRDLWSREGGDHPVALPEPTDVATLARREVLATLQADTTRFRTKDGRLIPFADAFTPDLTSRTDLVAAIRINERGLPYNAMGQSGMAYFLYQLAAHAEKDGDLAGRDAYRRFARLALATVTTDIKAGGLASTVQCRNGEDCTWFHSVTRRDREPEEGATLNQNLHAIRDMGLIQDTVRRLGWDEPDLEPFITAGVNRLFLSDTAPTLDSFAGPSQGKDGTWAYYGFSPQAGTGYFLKKPIGNCHYHVHVLELLATILKRAQDHQLTPALNAAREEGDVVAFRRAVESALNGEDTPAQIGWENDDAEAMRRAAMALADLGF